MRLDHLSPWLTAQLVASRVEAGECTRCGEDCGRYTCDACDEVLRNGKLALQNKPAPSCDIVSAALLKEPSSVDLGFMSGVDGFYVDMETCDPGSNDARCQYEISACIVEGGVIIRWCALLLLAVLTRQALLSRRAHPRRGHRRRAARVGAAHGPELDGRRVVAYGSSHPEKHRIASLMSYLPLDYIQPKYTYFDPQTRVLDKLCCREPSAEADDQGRIYQPSFALSDIHEWINLDGNKSLGLDSTAFTDPSGPDDAPRGKSVPDTAKMFNLMVALHAIDGAVAQPADDADGDGDEI